MSPTRLLSVLLLAALLAGLPGALTALAHTVETVDGEVYEGEIVTDDDEHVVIDTTFGDRVTVPRAKVKKVDKTTFPLREQLRIRADYAKDDVQELWHLYRWAKKVGFVEELRYILLRVITLNPDSSRAHKLLGHEKVDDEWMTPDEKEYHLAEKHAEEMRAQGLVEYEDRWVTPEEKDALEKGLLKDGDEWVTEEEYHQRRGERLIDGEWVRIGEKEAKAWAAALKTKRVAVRYEWFPNLDVYYDVKEEHAKRSGEGGEKAFAVFRSVLRPGPGEFPTDWRGRVRLHLFLKLPAYARFAGWFEKKENCSGVVKGWLASVRRQHSFWWVDPVGVVGAYKFPNTPRTLVSHAVHNLGLILLTRYNFNYRFPPQWLQEGWAYFLEIESIGYTETFSLSRGGTGAAAPGASPVWADSDQWRSAIRNLVGQGQDPPMKRLSRMTHGQLHYVELVKSWSVVEFLVRYDREKFKAFIDSEKDRALTPEDALKKVYGWGWRDLDRQWRKYVAAGFQVGGPPVPAEGEASE